MTGSPARERDERGDTMRHPRYARCVRGLAIAAVCLVACSPNAFGNGSGGVASTSEGVSTSTGLASTTGSGSSSSSTTGATVGTTALDGTTTGSGSDGSSSTTGPMLACGEVEPTPDGCDTACELCQEGVCLFDCAGAGDCTQSVIVCPSGRPCTIECTGTNACLDIDVVCPPAHECIVLCYGDEACGNMHVACGAAPCSVACNTHMESCSGLELYCGSNDGTVTCNVGQLVPPTAIPVGSDCACDVIGCG